MQIADDLVRIAKGETFGDSWNTSIYSVDASHYELQPTAVVFPADQHDVEEICKYSYTKKVPITARGSGTGLLGQSLSEGIVLDFTKHMNKILEIGKNTVTVQPGIVKAVLDKELKKKDKFLPPDPASSNYCSVGGMIANNSSGIHCLGYGNTIDFLEDVHVVYSDGKTGFASAEKYDKRIEKLYDLLQPVAGIIQTGYPKVSKNSCGYRLDMVIGKKFQPHKLFSASEGTLGILTSCKLRILDIPEYRSILVVGFGDLVEAVSMVPAILEFFPVALEMMDHTVVSGGQISVKDDNRGCIIFIEFVGNQRLQVEERTRRCAKRLAGKGSIIEEASDDNSISRIWQARKGALNNIMKMTVGSRKPIGLIEDTVVSPLILVDHIANMLKTYHENKLGYVMFGHVGDGNVHTRPIIDIDSKSQVELMESIASDIFAKVIKSGGTITGEHGDGIARVKYIKMMYGEQLTSVFVKVKKLFDPDFMLNPGKKVLIQ